MSEEKQEVSGENPMAKTFEKLGLDANTQRLATRQALSHQDKFSPTGLEEQYVPEKKKFDQGFLEDAAAGIYNGLIIQGGEGLANLVPTVANALGADSEFMDSWMTNVTDFFEDQKAIYSDDANAPIHEFKDITSSHTAQAIGQGIGFIAGIIGGGGVAGAVAKGSKLINSTTKARRLGSFLSGTTLMYPEIQKEAVKAGLDKGDAARFSLAVSGLISLTEGAALEHIGKIAAAPLTRTLGKKTAIEVIKEFGKSGGRVSEKMFLKRFGQKMAARTSVMAEGAAVEFGQEFTQTYIEEGAKQLWDTVYEGEKGKGKFGSDITTYQSFVEATFGGLIGGLLGGGMASLSRGKGLGNELAQEGMFGYINNAVQQGKTENIVKLRDTLTELQKTGKIDEQTVKSANKAITKLENFAKDVKPKGIKDGVANYQLFQLNELGSKAVEFADLVNPSNAGNPSIANDYANRQGMIKEVQASIAKNFDSIFESKKALTKNKVKFEKMLSSYGKLLTDIKNTDVTKEEFDKRIKEFEVKPKKETKGDVKEDIKPEEGDVSVEEKVEAKQEEGESKGYGDEIKIEGSKLTPSFEEGKYVYRNKKGEASLNNSSAIKKLSKTKGVIASWWNKSLSKEKRDEVRNRVQHFLESESASKEATISDETVIMKALRGVKFSKKTSEDLTDVKESKWISEEGQPLDTFVREDLKEMLSSEGLIDPNSEIDEAHYTEFVKDIIETYPNGITKGDISRSATDTNAQEAEDLIEEFAEEYGLDLATVAEKINLEKGTIYEEESTKKGSKEQKDSGVKSDTKEKPVEIKDKDVPFQKEGIVKDKTDLISKNPTLFGKIKDKFSKLFPNTPSKVVDKIIDDNGGEVLGRIYKAGIEISKDKATQTTLIHENAHVFLDLLGMNNPVVKAGIELIRGSEFHKKAQEAYPELDEKGQLKEALIEALSQDTLEDLKTRFEGTNLEKFQAFLKRFWNRTKAMFNADDRTAIEMLRDDLLLRGEKVKTEKVKTVPKESKSQKAEKKNEAIDNNLAKARKVFSDFGRTVFGSIHTKSLIENNPKVAEEIIDSLKALYPKIKINKGGIVKDGKFVPLRAGEKGMHIRNAFNSMVAWANDAYLETPPHEYAHAYIEMYSESPIVKEAIKKYGSIETVASIMGRHYAGKKVTSSFKNWVDKFWNFIKGLVGSPDIGYKLSEAFRKGEKLSSSEEPGFNVIEYQKKTPLKNYSKSGGVDTSGLTEMSFTPTGAKESIDTLFNEAKDTIDIKSIIYGLVEDYKDVAKDVQGTKGGYRNVVDKRLLADLKVWANKDANLKRVKDYLDGKNEFPDDVTAGAKRISYESILTDLVNAKNYEETIKNSVVTADGKIFSIEGLGVDKEISETAKNRKDLYNKIKWRPLRNMFKFVEKAIPYITNSMYVTKYLSGSENSTLSNFYYKAINYGENLRNSLISEFNDNLMIDSFSDVYDNWSAHKNPKLTINELDTKIIKTQDGDIELTMAELLGFYLASRQARARKPMLKNGIIIDKEIEGRDIPLGKRFSLSKEQMNDIESTVKNDADLMKNVANIDKAMKSMSKELANTYLRDNGIKLRLEGDYTPVYSGDTSYNERRSKSSVDDFKSIKLALGENEAIRIIDPMQVLDSYKVNAATYTALTLPIKNNRKIIESIEKSYGQKSQERIYINSLKETLNQLEDPAQLFSGQGEKAWTRNINKITSNFAVSVLGMNIPVMIKQSISYITAANEISGEYLTMAGGGVNAIPVINPKAIFKAITDPIKKKSLRWDLDTNNGTFALMKKYSPAIKARIEGLSDRELGEASMGEADGSDTITMPWNTLVGPNKGKPMKFSKSRFMEGIRIFDAVTIENIWRAAEFEAEAEYDVKRGTDEFYEHVAKRVETIISKTQPTFNLSDRTGLAKMPDFLARGFTMFSSATSKMAMLQIDGVLDFIANPTKENQMKLIKRSTNILVTTALITASIDMAKGMLIYGWDDDDELMKETLITAAANNIGLLHGIGQIGRVTASQLDDKPWFATVQTPFESLAQSAGGVLANAAKGNVAVAMQKSLELSFKSLGLPMEMISKPRQAVKRIAGE